MLNKNNESLRFDAGDFAYGTWRILDDETPATVDELAKRLHNCLECGITTLDTAEIYGGYLVEEAVGRVLKSHPELREGFKVVTKAGIDVPSAEKRHATLPHYNATSQNLVHCAEKSLRLLGVDSIDLFLVHRPDWLTSPEDTAASLQKLLDEGKAKYVGVSNYSIHQFETLDLLLNGQLATNQVEFGPLEMTRSTMVLSINANKRRSGPWPGHRSEVEPCFAIKTVLRNGYGIRSWICLLNMVMLPSTRSSTHGSSRFRPDLLSF
jgi:predicted oxidoreductase